MGKLLLRIPASGLGGIQMLKWKCLIFGVMFLIAHTRGYGAQIDEQMFEKLSPQERVAFALSCLRSRDLLLENFSYGLTLRTCNIEVATGKDVHDFPIEKYELSRSGDTSLLHGWTVSDDVTAVHECFDRWDGKERRALSPAHGKEHPRPGIYIDTAESLWVGGVGYNLLFGYRAFGPVRMSLSKWVGIPAGGDRNSIEVSIDRSGKDALLLVHIRETGYTLMAST